MKLRLHTRLLLAYGYLVALVLVGAAGAALGFHTLGNRLNVVLGENFDSVRASMDMLEALERQDGAVVRALLGREGARETVTSSEREFLDALGRARANVTEEDERPVLASIEAAYSDYRAARDALLDGRDGAVSSLAAYERDGLPYFVPVKTGVRSLLELNHRAMLDADRAARQAARDRAVGYAALTALALVSLGVLSRGLRRGVISRLDELRGVAGAVRRGDLRRRAAEDPADELGEVARELNRLLDAHDELRGRFEARQSRLRDLIVGLLGTLAGPAAYLAWNGDLIGSTFDEADTARIAERARAEVAAAVDEAGGEDPAPRAIDERLRLEPVLAAGRRPVGWLVRLRR